MNWPFEPLSPMSYGFIMADPPWQFENFSSKGHRKGAAHQYDCMGLEAIKGLPVGCLAAGDCLLMLWACNPMLDQAFAVLKAWGFRFKTAGHWCKRTKNGGLAFGTGYVLRGAGEPFLIGSVGAPKTSRSCRSVIEGQVREHSRKPEEAYAFAEKLVPDVRRADVFSRQQRPGWDCWGNEIGKFDRKPEAAAS